MAYLAGKIAPLAPSVCTAILNLKSTIIAVAGMLAIYRKCEPTRNKLQDQRSSDFTSTGTNLA